MAQGNTRLIDPGAGVRPVYQVPPTGAPVTDQVAVDDDPVVEILPATDNAAPRSYAIIIHGEAGDDTVYISGEDDVTPSTGFPLIGGASIPWPSQAACYGVCGTSDSTTVSTIDYPAGVQ